MFDEFSSKRCVCLARKRTVLLCNLFFLFQFENLVSIACRRCRSTCARTFAESKNMYLVCVSCVCFGVSRRVCGSVYVSLKDFKSMKFTVLNETRAFAWQLQNRKTLNGTRRVAEPFGWPALYYRVCNTESFCCTHAFNC